MTDQTQAPAASTAALKAATKAAKAVWDLNKGSMTQGIRVTLAKNLALLDGQRNAEAVRAACKAQGITSPDSTIDTITADMRATVRALRDAGRMAKAGEAKGKGKAN